MTELKTTYHVHYDENGKPYSIARERINGEWYYEMFINGEWVDAAAKSEWMSENSVVVDEAEAARVVKALGDR